MIGLYLVPKHAELIYQGKKKAIIKRRALRTYLRNDLELITKLKGVGYALGKIKLAPPKFLSLNEIKKLEPLHKVSEREIKEWFPYAKKLYYYPIEKFEKYEKPKIIQIKPGVQTIQHFLYSEDFIKDAESYNPSALRKKVLQDDWRIVCFTEDTPVLTPRGIEKISEVQPTHDMDYLRMQRDYSGKLMSIKIDRLGTFKMTPEHPVFVRKIVNHSHSKTKVFGYVSVRKKGLPKETGGWITTITEPMWKLAKDLKRDDAVIVPKFPTEKTPYSKEVFELSGWYLAEGFPCSDSCIRFSLSRAEKHIADRIKFLAEKEFKAKATISILDKEMRVNVYSKSFHDFCLSNFSHTAKNKKLPYWLFLSEPDKIKVLLDAWRQGDGSDFAQYHKGSTSSLTLAYGLFLLYLKVGIVPSLSHLKGETNFGSFDKYQISYVDKPRKTFLEDDKFFYFPIRKVSEEYFIGKVYNLETKSHLYQVPFIVHNCAWYSSKKQGKKIKFSMEQILSLAKKIYQELLRRGIQPGQTKLSGELIKKIKKEFSKYLPIYRGSESKEGEEIRLEDFLKKWKPFIIHKDFIQLVGSLANWEKTVGDIDILIKAEPGTTLWNLTTWRILRAYPEYQDRFHFIPYSSGNWQGPFTCHIPLGDLCLNIDQERFKRIEMSKDFKRDPEFKKNCLISEKEDKLIPFRPFFQEKPQHGRNVGEAYNLDSLVEVVNKTWPNWKEKGIYVGIKRDGATCQVHFDKGKVKIWTEDGSDVTDNLPTIVSQFAKKPGKCVVIGELEWYHKGKHMPRSDTAGIINHKDPKEKEVRITIYDKLYSDSYKGDFGDMHKKPYSFRREQYTRIHEDKNIKISNPEYLVKDEKSLRKYVERCSNAEGSEGAMLKLATASYPLTIHPHPPTMIKFKKERQLIAKVIRKDKVEGAKAWVYDCALKDSPYAGKTYNTSIEADIGDHIIVSFVDISGYIDPKTKVKWVNWWAPHVIAKTDKPVDSVSKAWKFVKETTGRIEEKPVPKRGLKYHPETAKGFSKSKKWVLQAHIRLGTCHGDFRYAPDHFLKGFTLAFQTKEFKDKALKPIKIEKEKNIWTFYWNGKPYYQVDIKQDKVLKMPTKEQKKEILQYYKSFLDDPSLWKIDLNSGEEKKRDEKEKIYCLQKSIEPYDWINVEGVTDPRIIEPVPGGTRNGPGIFIIIDEGTYEMGADKPYFKEFFLHGKKFKGRYCFRLVSGLKETRKLMDWLYWKPDDQTPYVLSKRAIKEKWLPKEGSALPADLERKVPPNLCYWKKGLSTEEKLRRREEVAKFLLKDNSFMADKFILTRRFWKGQEVIRKAEVSDYHLKFGKYQFHLDKNPTINKATCLKFSNNPEYFIPGKYPPKSKINPNKKIPVYIEIIDSGPYEILKEEPKRIQVKFDGKKLKGLHYLISTDGIIFQIVKQNSPKTFSREIFFRIKDFRKEGKVVLSSEIKFPFRFKTVAFSEGTWHDTFYPWEVIKEAAPRILDAPAVTYHVGPNDPILTEVGKVVDYEIDEKNKRIIVECELFDTTAGRDCAVLLANKRIPAVSVRILEDSEFGECKKIISWPHIAFVREGEVEDAKICYDGICPA